MKPSNPQPSFDFLAPAEGPGEIGRLGGYRILNLLGQGGMGMVFRAEDINLQRLVALKVMRPEHAKNPSSTQRFLREARATAALKHDHIVTIYQVGQDRAVPFIAMEFLQGEPLDSWLKKNRPTLAQSLKLGREIAAGLAAAHEKGLIHRDIKPANIWLEAPKGRVKILDLGLARSGKEETKLTQVGAILGTPAYMSPEQARADKVDGRTDLFSLGCILYQLCTGQTPFQGDSVMGLLMAVATVDPQPPQEVNPDVPPAVAELIMKLLAKKPEDRPARAKVVVEAIQALEKEVRDQGSGIRGQESGVGAPAPKRRLLKPALLCALVLAVAGAIAWGAFRFLADEGTLVVETDDPETQVIVNQDGKFVAAIDPKIKQEIVLKSGVYQLALADANKGLRLSAKQIDLKRGTREVVTISLKRAAEKKPDVQAKPESSVKAKVESKPEPKKQPEPPLEPKLPPLAKVDPKSESPPQDGLAIRPTKSFTNSIGIKLVLIPAGKFMMGSPDSEKNRGNNEGPQHEVEITKPFYVGVTEVTQEEYEKVMGTNPSQFKGKKNPVETVSWNEAVEFCKKLTALEQKGRQKGEPGASATGVTYRLLTEAEWEYACRGGSGKTYCFGDDAGQLPEYAWSGNNSGGKTHPVGTWKPNAFGLHDMHGNVYEWCGDWYDKDYYKRSPVADPRGPTEALLRVIRGGGWRDVGWDCRSAPRNGRAPASRYNNLGFRVAAVQSRTSSVVSPAALPEPKLPPLTKVDPIPEKSFANSIGMKLVLIPAGKFMMGSPETEKARNPNEGPRHEVEITRPFYMGVCEVTQAEYKEVMGQNPSYFSADGQDKVKDMDTSRFPVENVSWEDAREFCRKLAEQPEEKRLGRIYRLPTEAEWEYACRAGSDKTYYFGDDDTQLVDYAWYSKNAGSRTHAVGTRKPNAFGLHDMHGNVWEWCSDYYVGKYLSKTPHKDPQGPESGIGRVLRGGTALNHGGYCRTAFRRNAMPDMRSSQQGFRVVYSLAGRTRPELGPEPKLPPIPKVDPKLPPVPKDEPKLELPAIMEPKAQPVLASTENTRRFLQAGGTEASEQAVALGLQWLASQQGPDDSWSLSGKTATGKSSASSARPNCPRRVPCLRRSIAARLHTEAARRKHVVSAWTHAFAVAIKPGTS